MIITNNDHNTNILSVLRLPDVHGGRHEMATLHLQGDIYIYTCMSLSIHMYIYIYIYIHMHNTCC